MQMFTNLLKGVSKKSNSDFVRQTMNAMVLDFLYICQGIHVLFVPSFTKSLILLSSLDSTVNP